MKNLTTLIIFLFLLTFSGCYTQVAFNDPNDRNYWDALADEDVYENEEEYYDSDTLYLDGEDTDLTLINNYYSPGDYSSGYHNFLWGYYPSIFIGSSIIPFWLDWPYYYDVYPYSYGYPYHYNHYYSGYWNDYYYPSYGHYSPGGDYPYYTRTNTPTKVRNTGSRGILPTKIRDRNSRGRDLTSGVTTTVGNNATGNTGRLNKGTATNKGRTIIVRPSRGTVNSEGTVRSSGSSSESNNSSTRSGSRSGSSRQSSDASSGTSGRTYSSGSSSSSSDRTYSSGSSSSSSNNRTYSSGSSSSGSSRSSSGSSSGSSSRDSGSRSSSSSSGSRGRR